MGNTGGVTTDKTKVLFCTVRIVAFKICVLLSVKDILLIFVTKLLAVENTELDSVVLSKLKVTHSISSQGITVRNDS
jgi:hypothetical protein